MKAIIFLAVAAAAALFPFTLRSQEITARVLYAADSIPVEFATVKLMLNDSVMTAVTLTDELGRFSFDTPVGGATSLYISSVGCMTKHIPLPCDSIIYLDSSNELTEVVVRGSKQHIKATPRGLTISMTGNPVSGLGSAAEALRQLPMIDASTGGISVLGHGTPVIYINNRQVRDTGELSTLAATDITDVEIITNPSSQYGADVTSVIIIRTRKPSSGFHSVVSGNLSAAEEWSGSGDITLNYHTERGLTLFGDISYGASGFRQSRYYGESFYPIDNPAAAGVTDTYATARSRSRALKAEAGLNHDFGSNSSGIRYTFSRTPESHYTGNALSMTHRQQTADTISSLSDLNSRNSMHHVNAFGNFALPMEIGLRIDADYVDSRKKSDSGVTEEQTTDIMTRNDSHGILWAGKMVLSGKTGNIGLEAGADISHTRNIQHYTGLSSGGISFLRPETDNVKQNLRAGFLSFDWMPDEKWNLYGGFRFEATSTTFRQNDGLREDLSKTYSHLLPNVGFTFNSDVRATLYYRATVSRPGYQSLDNTYVYVTPTLWETGNPALLPTLRHRIGINLSYRKFMMQSSFTINRRSVSYAYFHESADGININRPVNLPKYYSFQLVAIQQLDFSFWHPTLQGVFYVQNLKYGTPSRKYDKPLYTLSLNNRFDLPCNIYAYLNLFRLGIGHQELVYSKGTWQLSMTLNKTWREWTFTLSANDILGTWRQRFDTRTNTVDYISDIKGASRFVSLSIRYTLNSAKGQYRGKTSRQDEIDRL